MEGIIGIIIALIVGLVAGGAGGWLVQTFRAKSRLATQTAEHQAAIAGLQVEHDKATADAQTAHLQETAALNAQIAGLNGQLERLPLEHQTAITKMKAEHDEKVAELQAGHQQELAHLNEQLATLPLEHQTAITKLKAEHDEKVAELQSSHQQELARLNEQLATLPLEHQAAITKMKADHDEKVAELQAGYQRELAARSEQLATQPLEHQEAIVKLRAEHDNKVAELQAGHQQELGALNEKIADLNGQMEQVASAQQMLETAKAQFSETAKLMATDALQSNNQRFLELAKENFGATLETAQRELDQRHQQFQQLVKPLSDQYTQLTDTFQTTATVALQNNREQFLELAKENLGTTLEAAKSEFHQRHQQFQELVKPLSENYGKLNPQIETLTQQVGAITSETARLSGALKGDNRAVGNWGEIQLHRVVEMAGMTDYCDFAEQQTAGNSQERPDLIVNLPEQRTVIVDAKASTAAYLEISEAPDAESAQAAYDRHAAALRRQVDSLSGKEYGAKDANSLNFVVMFVPGDQFLSAALNAYPGLIDYAMSKRVAIATPASLIAMLWAVANGWQQYEVAHNAEELRRIGAEMHRSLAEFITAYGRVEQRIRQAVEAFNTSVRVMENQVLDPAREMASMGVGNADGLKSIKPITRSLRQLPAIPETTEQQAA